jgi:hypothetical protein
VALVNDVIVDYFMVDLELNGHFVSLHRYLLLQDGEFSQTLTDQLFEKVHIIDLVIYSTYLYLSYNCWLASYTSVDLTRSKFSERGFYPIMKFFDGHLQGYLKKMKVRGIAGITICSKLVQF